MDGMVWVNTGYYQILTYLPIWDTINHVDILSVCVVNCLLVCLLASSTS